MQNGDYTCAETGLGCGALYAGIAVPCLYYGVQAVAAPFFSEFSFVGTTASELGSERSSYPALFNYGTMLLGVAWLVASVGFFRAFQRLGVHPVLAWPILAALIVAGIGSFWAGWYPLPDPRHAGHPAFLVALLSLPILLTIAHWKRGHSALRAYFVANLVLLAVMFPIMSGFTAPRHPHLSRTIPADVRAHGVSARGRYFCIRLAGGLELYLNHMIFDRK